MNYKIYNENCLTQLDQMQENCIDSIVTDPPYELNFMGKGWDNAGVSFNKETWKKCLRVLKPGGYLLAFGGSRTFHRIAVAIEDAGFEIRDTIMWLYGSGFPKSMSLGKVIEGKQVLGSANARDIKKLDGDKETVTGGWISNELEQGKRDKEYEQIKTHVKYKTELGKKWDGWGTCLKPSFEPIIVARKPFKGSLVDNVIEWGVGGLNIDECRVEAIDKEDLQKNWTNRKANAGFGNNDGTIYGSGIINENNIKQYTPTGRFPANTILTYDQITFDEVCGGFPNTKSTPRTPTIGGTGGVGQATNFQRGSETSYFNDSGSASRYFYCAKASKKDRDEGLDEFEEKLWGVSGGSQTAIAKGEEYHKDSIGLNQTKLRKNTHPTVKPTELMQYLIRLVTPQGGVVLDPFMGSGSTGKAVAYENKERNKDYKFIGIELNKEYCNIAKARIDYADK